jgi:Fe2+ or Zn2+ uptake regulation protein
VALSSQNEELPMHAENDPNDLKNVGLKATFPRLKILDIFRKSGARHLSAEDVYRALIGESIDIGLATVYRVLTQFEQAGILARSQFDGGKAHIVAKWLNLPMQISKSDSTRLRAIMVLF